MTVGAPRVRPFVPAPGATGNAIPLVILGLISPFYAPVFGVRVYAVELVLFALLPVIVISGRNRTKPVLRYLGTAGALWLVGQVFTDAVRHTPVLTGVAAAGNILLFLVDLFVLFGLLTTPRRLAAFAGGLAAGMLVATQLQPTPDFALNPWKFGYAIPLALAGAIFLLSRKKNRSASSLVVLGALAALNLLLDYRSLAFVLGIAALVALRDTLAPRRTDARQRHSRVWVFALLAVVFLIIGNAYYSDLASTGALGASAKTRFESQSVGEYGVVVGARKEILGMLVAIADSPVIGAGAGAGLTSAQFLDTVSVLKQAGYPLLQPDYQYLGQDPLPAHSAIVGAWFLGGILSLPFWLLVLRRLWLATKDSIGVRGQAVYLGIAAWAALAILFSPLGADQRVFLGLALIAAMSRRA